MADPVKALTHWRRGREVVRAEHTREVQVRHEAMSEAAKTVLERVCLELDRERARGRILEERVRFLEASMIRLARLVTAEDAA